MEYENYDVLEEYEKHDCLKALKAKNKVLEDNVEENMYDWLMKHCIFHSIKFWN